MTIKLDKTKESLLEEINFNDTVEEEISWKKHEIDSDDMQRLYGEFLERYPNAIQQWNKGPASYEDWRWVIGRYLDETFQNSVKHGHRCNINIPIKVKRHYGKGGVVYEIEDKGEGFDVKNTFEMFLSGDESYHNQNSSGQGLMLLHESNMVVSYNDKRNIAYLQFKIK